jgi:hypothetical protein
MWRLPRTCADVDDVTGRAIRAAIVVAIGLPLALIGCKAKPGAQGTDRTILAAYGVRKLRTELPSSVRVPAVVAAADGALRDRGYGVMSSHATEDSGRVVGEARGGGPLQSVVVLSRVVPDGTRVEVLLKPWGDEERSRAILDDILVRLGL